VRVQVFPDRSRLAQPDYELLRAGLSAAQAATPTVRACHQLARPAARAAALRQLLGDLVLDAEHGCWLTGRFSGRVNPREERSTNVTGSFTLPFQ